MRNLKDLLYAYGSTVITLITSVLSIGLLPKVMEPLNFGLYQLFVFYSTFLGLFHLGSIDGIHLKNSGEENLSIAYRNLFGKQFILFAQSILFSTVIMIYVFYFPGGDKKIVLISIAILLPISLLRQQQQMVLQGSLHFKENTRDVFFEKVLFVLFVFGFYLSGCLSLPLVIFADVFSKFIALILDLYVVWRLQSPGNIFLKKQDLEDYLNDVFVGSSLLFANLCSLFIVGSARLIIEQKWGVVQFGKVSLSLQVVNFCLAFTNAIAVVSYPKLLTIGKLKLVEVYNRIDFLLLVFGLSSFTFFGPLKICLMQWLPKYSESFSFLVLLFPLIMFQTKQSVLANVYLKILRKERVLLFINLIALLISVVISVIAVCVNLFIIAICAIVFAAWVRCFASEYYIAKSLGNNFKFSQFKIFIAVIVYFGINYWTCGLRSFVLSFLLLSLFVVTHKRDVQQCFRFFGRTVG